MKKLTKKLLSAGTASKAALASLSMGAVSAFAEVPEATKTAVNDAFTDGGTLVGLAVAGLIGLVAIVVGVNLLINMLRKA